MRDKLKALLRKKFPYHTEEQLRAEIERRIPVEEPVVLEEPKVEEPTTVETIDQLAEQNVDVTEEFPEETDEEDTDETDDEAPVVEATPDDLTQIKGIGKKLQEKLNAVGITTFQEIADLTPEDVDRVSAVLDFKGSIDYEEWIEQATELAN